MVESIFRRCVLASLGNPLPCRGHMPVLQVFSRGSSIFCRLFFWRCYAVNKRVMLHKTFCTASVSRAGSLRTRGAKPPTLKTKPYYSKAQSPTIYPNTQGPKHPNLETMCPRVAGRITSAIP